MPIDIEITAEDDAVRGLMWTPRPRPAPVVVMAHGFSGVKELGLVEVAESLADRGLGVVLFDYRNLGASEGEPRQEIDPWAQVCDYRNAITFASLQPELDSDRIGVWGTSYSGGHVLVVAAIDRRVRCAVSQVGYVGMAAELPVELREAMDRDRVARFRGEPPAMIPVVSSEASAACVIPGADALGFFDEASLTAPSWRNEVTLRSVEMLTEYEPGAHACRITAPLLVVAEEHDMLTTADRAAAAADRSTGPSRVVRLPGGHFDVYGGDRDEATAAAASWFEQHLAG